jgi:heme A synthase
VAEVILLFALVAIPVAAGVATVYLRWPWWWAATVAVVVFLIAAIAPTPEPGEARSMFVTSASWQSRQ